MQTYFVLKPFLSPLGNFEAGTEAHFGDGTARVLKANHIIADLGSAAYQAYLANQASEPAVETKPAPEAKPAAKRATKAK